MGDARRQVPRHRAGRPRQFAIASILENEKGEPAAAIERYRKVVVEPVEGQAAQRIALMEAKSLAVVTARTFRSGETPRLKIATRNLEKLTFTAYKIDPETYFRKKHMLAGVEALDIGLVAPDAEWTAEVPEYGKYRPIETTYELKKLEMPGVYVVKVSDEKTLQATTMVLGSDLDAIVKTSREQVLVFAQDMKTGMGRAGARVLGLRRRRGDPRRPHRQGRGPGPRLGQVPGAGPGRTRLSGPSPCRSRSHPGPSTSRAMRPGPGGTVARSRASGRRAGPGGRRPARRARPGAPHGALSYLVLDGDHVAGSGLGTGKGRPGALRSGLPLHRPARLPARTRGRAVRRGARGHRRPVRQIPRDLLAGGL